MAEPEREKKEFPKASEAKEVKDVSEKEQRIREITKLYYAQPQVQQVLLEFSRNREVVPRYFEGFGKRPDTLQYPSDIMGLVNKRATSFHASEEIWSDPLRIHSEMTPAEMNAARTSWDLLIDIDSPFIDWSKIVAQLILEALEAHGVKNVGLKFSGGKGFHLIVSGKAFPSHIEDVAMHAAFPEWPRAICRYLMHAIRATYNQRITQFMPSLEMIQQRTQKKKEDLLQTACPTCGKSSKKGNVVTFVCDDCGTQIKRKDFKLTKRELRCINCPGILRVLSTEEYFVCPYCNTSSFDKLGDSRGGKTTYTKEARASTEQFSGAFSEQISGEVVGGSDLVLVAPRHLFRMPYSLHEKTALASIVLRKEELATFTLRDANPLKLQIRPYLPEPTPNEGARLLSEALAWKKEQDAHEQQHERPNYAGKTFEPTALRGVTEAMFPPAIVKLLEGLEDGKKRGLFVLITFLNSCGFSPTEVDEKVHTWNTKNQPPLKEGYLRTQLDWHFRQKKKILPPNYANESFYRDLGLIKEPQKTKNPLVDVARKLRGY